MEKITSNFKKKNYSRIPLQMWLNKLNREVSVRRKQTETNIYNGKKNSELWHETPNICKGCLFKHMTLE